MLVKYEEQQALQKSMLAEYEFKITEQNQLYRALYEFVSTGVALGRDSKMSDYVKEGYEGNPDLFSIVLKLAGIFSEIISNAKLVQKKGDKEVTVENDEISRLFEKINYYQSLEEFAMEWIIWSYITGNSITYAPRLPAGMNAGKLTGDGMIMMPTQNVEIFSKGWRKPIGYYTLDINETYRIAPTDVWHTRFAPMLQYENGKNFMGMSPVKVASDIINSQNAGYQMTAKMFSYGHPPGILSKEAESGGDETTDEQESKFRKAWLNKYTGIEGGVPKYAIPVFTMGKLNYTKIGYDNLKELEIVSMSEHGRRVFCNLLQVPSQLFNDTAGTTFNNMNEASKAIYTNRIMPDVTRFCNGLNRILRAYGDFYLKPDYSDVEALQEGKAQKAVWVSTMLRDGVITGDEYLELMGMEPTGLPEMQIRTMDANRLPVDFTDASLRDNANKFYKEHGIENKL